jgi:predicted CXXCH cytochrome family protein
MKNISRKSASARLATTTAVLVLLGGVLGGSQALAQIASSKHNLGSEGTGVNKFDGTAELCVFCHTPHGADITASVPLWNRALPAANTYTTYNSLGTSSLDGATVPVGSVSIACLSCHDGSQAMNVMINQPGSGGYTAGGAAMAGNWTGANQTSGKLSNVGMITNIGVDLRNDHPIGIQYGGGPATTVPAAGSDYSSFKDADFKPARSQSLNSNPVWWVDTGTQSNGRQKTDMLLYTRSGATATNGSVLTGAQPFVECASCHDPHTTANPTFLRTSNANSAVCLACHTK